MARLEQRLAGEDLADADELARRGLELLRAALDDLEP